VSGNKAENSYMHDIVITGGTVVDGSGVAPYQADVAVKDGRIAAIGVGLGGARERIDARGKLVTPGFVDIHTHFDAQATWDDRLEPAVWHGVTTVIIGNCGVGFAPVRPENRAALIDTMSNVEDIPAATMQAGIPFDWESYPEYLRAIDSKRRTIDVGSMMTHATLRLYVMGARVNETPTRADIAAMADLVREGMRAGAVGLSTSRTILHTSTDGTLLPGTFASEDELVELATAVREGGGGVHGVFQVVPPGAAVSEPTSMIDDVDMLIRVAQRSRCPTIFLLVQSNYAPHDYATILEHVSAAASQGVPIRPQVSSRPVGALLNFPGGFHPFAGLPSFAALRGLPHPEFIAKLRDPAVRARLLVEENPNPTGTALVFTDPNFWSRVFYVQRPFNYYPRLEDSLQSNADKLGVNPRELAYDALLADEGRGFILWTAVNWAERDRRDIHKMVSYPSSLIGLSDAGAHLTSVVDASQTTTVLTDWVRDTGPKHPHGLSLEAAVKKLTLDNAKAFGLNDRGIIATGARADINVIDLERLRVEPPVMVHDLPLGAMRLDQRAQGYVATIVAGEVTQRDGVITAARPGRLAVSVDAANLDPYQAQSLAQTA
jgi:N-acyl-D-aspartate/D-glutamate deacylase